MKKKLILLIFLLMILLALPMVFAEVLTDNSPFYLEGAINKTSNETFTASINANWTISTLGAQAGVTIVNDALSLVYAGGLNNGATVAYAHKLNVTDGIKNFTWFHGRVSVIAAGESGFLINGRDTNITFGTGDFWKDAVFTIREDVNIEIGSHGSGACSWGNTETAITGWMSDGTWQDVRIIVRKVGADWGAIVLINGTQAALLPKMCKTGTTITDYPIFLNFGTDEKAVNLKIDDWVAYNGSEYNVPEIVIDTTPPVITYGLPENNTRQNIIPLIFNLSVSDDSINLITCVLRNESNIFNETTLPQDIAFDMTYNTSDTAIVQAFNFNITCFDNDEDNNNSATLLLNITIDNILPVITLILPENNTIIDKHFNNITYDALCEDTQPLAFNISLINESGDVIASFQNNTRDESEILLRGSIDLSNILIGINTLNYTCVDAHTYIDSLVEYSIKDDILNKIYYGTKSMNDVSIQLLASSLTLCNFNTYSLSDREVFWYDFTACNIIEKDTINEYAFMLRDNDGSLKYLADSPYEAHFVTDDNFITFHLNNDDKAEYKIIKFGKDYKIIIKTILTLLDFRNSIGGLNKETKFLTVEIIESIYTSLNHFDFPASTVIINSDVFIPIFNVTVNLTAGEHITLKGSGIIKKVTLPQATEVFGKLIVNNEILFESSILSTADVISFNIPIDHTDLIAGQNNISLEAKETDPGAINITNFIIEGDIDMSSHENEVIHSHNNKTITTATASFINIFNTSINRTINTTSLIDIQHRVINNVATSTTMTCYAESNATGEITPSYYSYLDDIDETGNAGIAYASTIKSVDAETWLLYCKTSNGVQVTHVLTGYAFLLGDNSENIIASIQSQSSAVTVVGASEILIHTADEFKFENSTEIDLIATISAQSFTGEHATPMKFKVNSTTINEADCLGTSESGFISSNDARTIKFYFDCEDNNRGNINLTAYAIAGSSESANILNVSITGYEVAPQPLSEQNIPPIIVITEPLSGSSLRLNNNIRFISSDPNSDNYIINISLINSTNTSVIAHLNKDETNFTFNFSTFSPGSYKLKATVKENESVELFENSFNISINIVNIIINLTSPANKSTIKKNPVKFKFDVDIEANCSFFFNKVWTINQSINATIGENSFESLNLENGSYFWSVGCVNTGITTRSSTFVFAVDLSTQSFGVLTCPNTTAGMMFLMLAVIIALFFIIIALMFKIGIFGVFGSILMIITSLYLSPCINMFAYAMALFSLFMLIWFALSGLGFINNTFK